MQPGSMALLAREAPTEVSIQGELSNLIGQRQYEHWFHLKTRFETHDDELVISVDSPFLLKWLQKQFKPAAVQAAQVVLGPSARVRFEVAANTSSLPASTGIAGMNPPAIQGAFAGVLAPQMNPAAPTSKTAVPESQGTALLPAPQTNFLPLHATKEKEGGALPKPTVGRRFADLSDFVCGPCNELALTAVRQVTQGPQPEVNPLYIYGPVGTGKTHLLEGIYRQLRRTQPGLQVVYLTTEAFTNYFTQALREHTLPSFRQRFRTVDVLLVDDIDFLDSKRVIQEEFLHTFKQLESHGKQIVVSSDRHPRLLSKVSDELKTRFLSGMVCRLEAPDAETRERIVTRKAARLDAEFSHEALKFVADRFTNNVRELEGALHCLKTYHTMTGKRVGITAARQVLADLERDCVKVVRMADIERVICDLFGLEAEELKSSKRTRSLSQPRMLAMYLARKHTRAAYSEIGDYFGGRNHSTVISAERKIDLWISDQTPMKVASQTWRMGEVLEALEQQLQAG